MRSGIATTLLACLWLGASGCGGDAVEGEGLELDARTEGTGRVFSMGFATGIANVVQYSFFRATERSEGPLLDEGTDPSSDATGR